MQLGPSELILNADSSIYHLNLRPEDIASTILTVGDPDRVASISTYFDTIELKKGKREFHTHTGRLNGVRLTVISTGIGTDNIDIVLNELDALANVNFDTRTIRKKLTPLQIIRIGTSGAIQPEIPIDSFLLSTHAIGFDSLLHYYDSNHIQELQLAEEIIKQTDWDAKKATPYVVKCDAELAKRLFSNRIRNGITATNTGFYGPQGRKLRMPIAEKEFLAKLRAFHHKGLQITNLEMETSGIYGLAKLMGHQAVSMNCILANRATGAFSEQPEKAVDELIRYTLDKLTS